jgi:hypothetical protein
MWTSVSPWWEDAARGVYVENLKHEVVVSLEHVMVGRSRGIRHTDMSD